MFPSDSRLRRDPIWSPGIRLLYSVFCSGVSLAGLGVTRCTSSASACWGYLKTTFFAESCSPFPSANVSFLGHVSTGGPLASGGHSGIFLILPFTFFFFRCERDPLTRDLPWVFACGTFAPVRGSRFFVPSRSLFLSVSSQHRHFRYARRDPHRTGLSTRVQPRPCFPSAIFD